MIKQANQEEMLLCSGFILMKARTYILQKTQVFNRFNAAERRSYDDIFFKRMVWQLYLQRRKCV